MKIREAKTEDYDGIWEIFREVIKTGDTFVFSPDTEKTELKSIWLAEDMVTYVAADEGKILGSYFLKPNQKGLGSHVANAGYMVRPEAQGMGIGRILCEDSIQKASELGYRAMQFNIVVSTNKGAIRLWEKFGFKIIGTIPEAFNHREVGLVDAYIMYKKL